MIATKWLPRIDYYEMVFSGLWMTDFSLGILGSVCVITGSACLEISSRYISSYLATLGKSTLWVLGTHGVFIRYAGSVSRHTPVELRNVLQFIIVVAGMMFVSFIVRRICFATNCGRVLPYLGLK